MARPLTKKGKDGNLYVRPRAIEAKIDGGLGQSSSVLAERAKQNDRKAVGFLPSEALVHLIRDAVRRGDERLANALIEPLLKRVEANLKNTIPDSRLRNAEAVREEVIDELVTLIAETREPGHDDDLDYFECKFGHALRTLRVNHVRKETTYRKDLVELPEAQEEADGDISTDEEILARLSKAAQTGASQEHGLELDELIEKVRKLPEDERRAVTLVRIIGHDEITAGKICGVTDRTIRNRLARATKRLKNYGENR
jgi:hypothetical protein